MGAILSIRHPNGDMELREDQLAVARRVEELLAGNDVALLKAPMGWGKTRVALAVAARRLPAAVLTPRLAVARHWWEEARAMGLPAVAAAGKPTMCALRLPHPYPYCHRCTLRQVRDVPDLGEAWTWEDVYDAAGDACPYHMQTALLAARRPRLLVMHYGMWRHADDASLVIIDEAHNFMLSDGITYISIRTYRRAEIDDFARRVPDLDVLDALYYLLLRGTPREASLAGEYLAALREGHVIEEGGERLVVRVDVQRLRLDAHVLLLSATPPPTPPEVPVIEVGDDDKPTAHVLSGRYFRWGNEEGDALLLLHLLHDAVFQCGEVLLAATRRVLLAVGRVIRDTGQLDLGRRVQPLEAWGKTNEGVDIPLPCAVVVWPTLHVSIIRVLREYGVDPDQLALIRSVQLAGRILRPPDRRGEKKIWLVGPYDRYSYYLSQHFRVRPL